MRQLSIIILQHNTPHEVTHCLKSLEQAWLPENTEIIVVNNGGNQANEKIEPARYKHLKVKFLDIPNKGYPQGNNAGLGLTQAEYYAFVNPDIEVEEDTLRILLDYFKSHPKVGIVSPQLRYPDNTVQDNFRVFPRFLDLIIKRTGFLRRAFPQRMREYLMWDREPASNEPVDWVTGALMIVSADCLKAVGGHNEDFFLFMSDLAMCRDAWEKGFEVHIVGEAMAKHNEVRASAGGFVDFFRKKTLRIHVNDALRYYWRYFFKKIPEKSPSLTKVKMKDRLLKTRELSRTSFLRGIDKKLQRHNPVVTVYRGQIQGNLNYEQPIVFFDTGVVGVVRNQKREIGLMKIWRHTPLQFHKKNTFPIFPDISHLGIWSLECTRGGVEKSDTSAEQAILRELHEEIGLTSKDIVSIRKMGRVIGNTAIDVYSHISFEIMVKDSFRFYSEEEVETIKDFIFFEKEELKKLIAEEKLCCGVSQAAILQSLAGE